MIPGKYKIKIKKLNGIQKTRKDGKYTKKSQKTMQPQMGHGEETTYKKNGKTGIKQSTKS